MQAIHVPQDGISDDDDDLELLSHYHIKQKIAKLMGVHSLMCNMCSNTCIAYTGPIYDLKTCPKCSQPCYNPASNRQQKIA